MLPNTFKKIGVCTAISIFVMSCGGSGGGSSTSTPVINPAPTSTNSAPTINEFTAQVSETKNNEMTFSWEVSDIDNDALNCVLSPGGQIVNITIDDCIATTSIVVSYDTAGSYTASLTVNDTSNATHDQNLAVVIAADNSLPEPVVTPSETELVIFYNREDNNYDGWGLHLWANEACDAYNGPVVEWAAPQEKSGDDPNYGAYWVVNLKADFSDNDCVNYIMHNGDNKAPNDGDQRAPLSGNRSFWLLDGIDEIYTEPTLLPSGVLIKNISAHWADTEVVFWQTGVDNVAKIRIYSSNVNELNYNGDTGISGDNYIEFEPTTNNANTLGMPRYSALDTFSTDNPDSVKIKQMLTGKLLAIAYNSDDAVLAASYVQTPRVLDALYTAGEDDADEAKLGLEYSDNDILVSLWAPTAQQVSLQVFDNAKVLQSTETMVVDNETGIWSFSTPLSNDRLFYRFELVVYHQQNQQFENIWSTDPYSVSLSTNGLYSQFVNLNDANLKPENWDEHVIPVLENKEDAVIYEAHIRNFSIRDESTSEDSRGKYLAFTEDDAEPVKHLKSLADVGLTYLQILPANDIASINEDEETRINLTNTVADLCAQNSTALVCSTENSAATLISVMESYAPESSNAQALAQSIRSLDSYNWGYDPKHFNVPEGSYSSNADGVNRIIEMRTMVKALHEMGLRTSLDVVYNHTSAAGLWENSVLDKVVPGYYYRRDLTTGNVRNETCCQDTETEHRMMDKLMSDSLVMWSREYKFDAFRFDIMGSHSKQSIINARMAVQAVDEDVYFYGEGWSRSDQGYEQAGQNEMAGSEIGTFNDRPRDTIRSGSLFDASASLNDQDIMRLGMSGTLRDYQLQDRNGEIKAGKNFSQSSYAEDPSDVINYVSKHDGASLWDQLQLGLSDEFSVEERVRIQNIAATMPLISQGIPFLQVGGDFIRSKSLDRNSYDSGDWFNFVDFTKAHNNWNVGLPLAEDNESNWAEISRVIANTETQVQSEHINFSSNVFKEILSIRRDSPLFRLTTAQDIYQRVGFHNTGANQAKGLIVMSVDDGVGLDDLDIHNDAIVVIVNGSTNELSHTVATATGFELHSVQKSSVDTTVRNASFNVNTNSGTFTVPALTTAIFIKPQGIEQAAGLAAGITRDSPDVAPYGNNTLYIRGSMNNNGDDGFTNADMFNYEGNGIYQLDTTLVMGEQTFTITSVNSQAVNIGFDDITVTSSSIAVVNSNGSLRFNAGTTGNYTFVIDASGTSPILTISAVTPQIDCSALADSSDAIPFNIAGDGQLYVKGDHSNWNAEEAFRLHYKGDNNYQAVASFDGDMQFKIASSDGSWTTQLWAQADGGSEINGSPLAIGVSYDVAYNNAGTDNNQSNLPAGMYSFLLTLNEANPSQGANVGQLIIQQCLP